jgi:hypothetical protein
VSDRHDLIVPGTLIALVLLAVPWLGVDAWAFVVGDVTPTGPFAALVRLTDGQWDLGAVRAPALLAAVLVAVLALILPPPGTARRVVLLVATVVVCASLLVPATLLQVGLRQSTAPWFHTNDAAYQVELAGERILDGENPYGTSYDGSGLERFYSLDGTPVLDGGARTVALDHLAYFPGLPLLAAPVQALPEPFDDLRLVLLLAALALIPAALLFPGPLAVRLSLGAVLAANPLMIRSTWFGIVDAPVVLCLVLAFALALRGRWGWTGVMIGLALAQKQYAFVAIPFLALAAWHLGGRDALRRIGIGVVVPVLIALVPFLIWDARALIDDTVVFGTSAYRIVGYGLSAILVDLGLVDRDGSYPFWLVALVIWLPVTLRLLQLQRRDPVPWRAAFGFAVSFLILAWVARYFQTSGFIFPLAGLAVAAAIAFAARLDQTPHR